MQEVGFKLGFQGHVEFKWMKWRRGATSALLTMPKPWGKGHRRQEAEAEKAQNKVMTGLDVEDSRGGKDGTNSSFNSSNNPQAILHTIQELWRKIRCIKLTVL